MEKNDLQFSEYEFSELSEYTCPLSGNNGNKGGWAMMAQPCYQDIKKETTFQELTSVDVLVQEMITGTEFDGRLKKVCELLDIWNTQVEAALGREPATLVDYLNPYVIERIPVYLEFKTGDCFKKRLLKRFYTELLYRFGLNPAFNPLAARIMVHFEYIRARKSGPKRVPTNYRQLDSYLKTIIDHRQFSTAKCHLLTFFRWYAEVKTGSKDNYVYIRIRELSDDDIYKYEEFLLDQWHKDVYASGTINLKWAALKKFFRDANDAGLTTLSVTGLPLPSSQVRCQEIKPILDEELKSILFEFSHANIHTMMDLTIVCLQADSGARISEILNLTMRNIERLGDFFTLKLSAKGKTRTIFLSGPASLMLENYLKSVDTTSPDNYVFSNLNGEQVKYSRLHRKFKKTMNDSAKGAFHRFRHGFITKALLGGANPFDVAAKVAHDSLTVTSGYNHPTQSFLKAESKKFPSLIGRKADV